MEGRGLKILVHVCCAPCFLAVERHLEGTRLRPVLYFHNPNIHPYREYERRLRALREYAETRGLPLEVGGYAYVDFLRRALVDPRRPARCRVCYQMRLQAASCQAVSAGAEYFTSTLLASPYQDHEMVRRLGEETARQSGTAWYYADFRQHWSWAQGRARQLGMYRQGYCGCIFSEEERYAR